MAEKSKENHKQTEEKILNEALETGQLIIGEPEEQKGLEISVEVYPELLVEGKGKRE